MNPKLIINHRTSLFGLLKNSSTLLAAKEKPTHYVKLQIVPRTIDVSHTSVPSINTYLRNVIRHLWSVRRLKSVKIRNDFGILLGGIKTET